VKSPNRIDPLAGPTSPNIPKPTPWYEAPWLRALAMGTLGATLAALCQFAPWPVAKAVCVAIASQLGSHAEHSAPP
jgi:hypothetical protein